MNDKITIHTTISRNSKKKLLEYGKNVINDGIENLIKIVESKEITVHIITEVKI